MHLFTGSPLALKKQFLETIKQKQNPLDRVLVLIPSKHLEARLKTELCQDLTCLAGVNFMPLGALAGEINNAAQNPPPPLLEDSPLLDFKVKNLLKKHDMPSSRNLAICFKNSFRDLINAEVTPETLALVQEDEDLILDEQKTYLNKFIPLYKEFLEIQKEPGKSTYKDFFIAARNNAAGSPFLKHFKQIIFYGFYDLTSLHYELIKAVICECKEKTQVYLPYEEDEKHKVYPAYTFVEPVYNTLFLPLAYEHTALESENNLIKNAAANIFTPDQKRAYNADIQIIKVSGEGEVQAAAKQILALHKNGFDYKDIALTFRGESGFNSKILEVFKQNQIPINYNFTFPLLNKPFAAFVYNLFNLESGNFAREEVLSVINSPYFAFRQDTFTDMLQKSGVECSVTQFEEMLDDSASAKQQFIDILKEIKTHIALLKQAGSFASLAQRAKEFLLKYTSQNAQKEQAETLKQIDDILNIISTYSNTGASAAVGEFLEEFFALLKEAVFNKVLSAPNAVEAADIMTLRLQDFKAVIILGLNEGILPLVPQQDPALKEVYRQSLRKPLRRALQNIGYLIHTAQNRYFEENFLFYLALSSSQGKAILTYKTSDNEGKTVVKSVFITLLLTVLGKSEDDLKSFSRRPIERLKKDIEQEFLTKEEAANLVALASPNSKEILAALLADNNEEKDLFEQSYYDLHALALPGALNNFDGIISPQTAAKIYPSYFSPTALSTLFSCPARHLFSRMSKEEDETFSRGALAFNRKGTLYHDILCGFYSLLKNKNGFENISITEAENLFKSFISNRFVNNNDKYGLYPLLWESIKQQITENLSAFIKEDLQKMQEDKFYPNLFEHKVNVTLNLDNKPFIIEARIDRIDKSADGKETIAVDYKSTVKSASIGKLIFTYNILQPPIYLEILNQSGKYGTCICAKLADIEFNTKVFTPLSLDMFKTMENKFKATLKFLHGLMLNGIFPIYPGDACKYCKFKDICRKNHLQTLRRAKKSQYFKELDKLHYVPSSR